MTLLVRDEADVIDATIAFHLNAGVDLVIATDHRSQDGTREILERYARAGYVYLIREEDEQYRESEFRTRMARLAATDFGADWVINGDADQFWWPRGEGLKEVLSAVPARFGIVYAFDRCFVPRPSTEGFFAERMTVRLTAQAPINDPTSAYRPLSRVAHRADPDVTVGRGSHSLAGSRLEPLSGWYPAEVLHFPWRSLGQVARKAKNLWRAFEEVVRPPTAYHTGAYRALEEGTLEQRFGAMVVDEAALEQGLGVGSLVIDTRLRDALRTIAKATSKESTRAFVLPRDGLRALRFARPGVVDDVEFAVDAAVLGEADVVRAQRRIDELERRIDELEGSLTSARTRGRARTSGR